ncbi:MAG TPA: transposase [Nitrospiria bacterium]|jgi:REP element-mobilizing transposase RayT
MRYNPEIHHRRSIRIKEYDYSQPGSYFITLCTQNRECWFGDVTDGKMRLNAYGQIVAECWQWLSEQYAHANMDEWIVMPNHLHGIIAITADGRGGSRTAPTGPVKQKPLGRLIGAFKTVSTKRINQMRASAGVPVWQRNYYEHIIRNEEDLNKIRQYILENPMKWAEDTENPNTVGV